MSNRLPDISTQFADWYNEVIFKAELVDHAPVRGSVVIRPYGCEIWERIKDRVDTRIKETGHHNALFPLLIPESFLKREAAHVEGFAPEVAVVTHVGGKALEEPYVVRPTSETIIHYMFARWIKSWRDLPLKINQWANVVRWEMRPRPFIRTTEFYWQEGHTAHETKAEALEEVLLMLNEYVDLAHNYLAIPVVCGKKPAHEKFPGAEETYTFEALMQDGKALQMGTSHLLSQSFAHAFDMKFQNKDGQIAYPYLTSWGVTTRLVGALIMVHGDQNGLIIPPRVAPIQVVIIPILKKDADTDLVMKIAQKIKDELLQQGIRVHLDTDETKTPGAKLYEWELKGIPVRLELGPRDCQNGSVMMANRVTGQKTAILLDGIGVTIEKLLREIHQQLFDRALARRDAMWYRVEKFADWADRLEHEAGFYQTGWCGRSACVEQFKEHKGTIRCMLDSRTIVHCAVCQEESPYDVLVAKAY